jgi:hypothetical protein
MRRIVKAHPAHPVNYLVATGKDVGRILKVAAEESRVRRRIRSLEYLIYRIPVLFILFIPSKSLLQRSEFNVDVFRPTG